MAPRRRPEDRPAPRRTPMAAARARRASAQAAPASAPAVAPGMARADRRAALTLVGTALSWALVTWAGGALGLPERVRALFDLCALAGFGVALYLTWQAWRARRAHPE